MNRRDAVMFLFVLLNHLLKVLISFKLPYVIYSCITDQYFNSFTQM